MTIQLTDTRHFELAANDILAVLEDVDRYPAWVRWVDDVAVLDRDEQGRVIAARVTVRTPMGGVVAELEFTRAGNTVSCALKKADMLSRFDATYTVTDHGAASQLDAELVVATTISFVPAAMIRSYGSELLKELLDAVEAEAHARLQPSEGDGPDGT